MYFKSIEIENTGPVDYVNITFHTGDETPKPMIIVGENGSGKSILLSHLVNTLLAATQEVYEVTEMQHGRVYKYRSPAYIKSGKDFSYARVSYTEKLEIVEWQLSMTRKSFEEKLRYTSNRLTWSQIPEHEASHFLPTFSNFRVETSETVKNQVNLYFPANRHEEPAWLNYDNLTERPVFTDLKRISNVSNRNVICISPLRDNRDWLMDLVFDRQLYEQTIRPGQFVPVPGGPAVPANVLLGFHGQSSAIYDAVIKLLKVILKSDDSIRLGIGMRKNRQISVMRNEQIWIPNLFQLSTGEAQLLNFFLSVLRDFDLCDVQFTSVENITGIVIIDEIDAHLHTAHQMTVLPELIATFPKIQFILTTHSPLFLMGMQRKFGDTGFNLINMPNGNPVVATDFSEFLAAHEAFKSTQKHRDYIRSEMENLSVPLVYVEGDYDIRYLQKAAQLLGRSELLNRVHLKDGGGFGSLDKVWKNYNNQLADVLPGKILLIYDCDTKKTDAQNGRVFKRVIPSISTNPIEVGIENLFPTSTIDRLESINHRFIDFTPEAHMRKRGENHVIPATKTVNKDEKGNICNWLCQNGILEDFENFNQIFDIMEAVLSA
jgi:Cdc6-like AAA superfamily ATPase